jgi:hypothetical protein
MNLLTRHDASHLLGASLTSLHEQSISWLEEINFWQNEMTFLYKLLNKRMPIHSYPSEKLSVLEKELIDIQTSSLDKTKLKVLNHEQSLANIMHNPAATDEENFREKHQELSMEVYVLQDVIKRFKTVVFALF